MNFGFSWPQKGDALFIHGTEWWLNACVGWSHDQWIGYMEGYRLAGDLMVQNVSETQSNHDFLIYPIIYCYRHAIEISLKYLLFKGDQLLNRNPTIRKTHRLVPLWRECRRILEEVWPDGSNEELDALGETMDQFDFRDPSSTVFRYPVDTEGRKSLRLREQISISNFSEIANRALTFLDGCCCGISEYVQQQWELERSSG